MATGDLFSIQPINTNNMFAQCLYVYVEERIRRLYVFNFIYATKSVIYSFRGKEIYSFRRRKLDTTLIYTFLLPCTRGIRNAFNFISMLNRGKYRISFMSEKSFLWLLQSLETLFISHLCWNPFDFISKEYYKPIRRNVMEINRYR